MKRSDLLHLVKDVLIFVISVSIAVFVLVTPIVEQVLGATMEMAIVVSFLAGIFFTSLFTVPVAIVVLGELGTITSPWLVAALGGLGAVVGDLFLFRFIRSHVSQDVKRFLRTRRVRYLFNPSRYRSFLWLLPFIGGIIIASPLPDELGVAILGATKLPTKIFVVMSYVLNASGILIIALIGQNLAS